MADILEVKNLRTSFFLEEGTLKALDGVSFTLQRNKTLGIIGESGCGKSVTAQSILRIVPHPGRIMSGEILYRSDDAAEPVDLVRLDPFGNTIRDIRGAEISMIFQEPMTSLSPVHTIGNQIIETIRLHRTPEKDEAREIAISMLRRVGINNPEQRIDEYPYQLSGGMRQRAMIAMALSCNPSVLIADEPTTALDVTVQAQILELMKELQEQFGMGIICITHNLGVIAEIADTVAVMYLGRIVEHGTAEEVFHNPLHPYTRRLLKSIPKLGKKAGTRLETIKGTVPIPLNRPARECGFVTRCSEAMAGTCDVKTPALVQIAGHDVRCFLHSDEEEPLVQIDERPKKAVAKTKETAK